MHQWIMDMKVEFRQENLETLRKLQARVSKTVSLSAASAADTILLRHQPDGQPPHSSRATAGPALCIPPIPPIQHPFPGLKHIQSFLPL